MPAVDFQVGYRGELPALDGMRCAIDSKRCSKGSKGFMGLLVDVLAPTRPPYDDLDAWDALWNWLGLGRLLEELGELLVGVARITQLTALRFQPQPEPWIEPGESPSRLAVAFDARRMMGRTSLTGCLESGDLTTTSLPLLLSYLSFCTNIPLRDCDRDCVARHFLSFSASHEGVPRLLRLSWFLAL